jgi:hypothetical protein
LTDLSFLPAATQYTHHEEIIDACRVRSAACHGQNLEDMESEAANRGDGTYSALAWPQQVQFLTQVHALLLKSISYQLVR